MISLVVNVSLSDRILSLTIWESCTLSKSRFLLPFWERFTEAWKLLNVSPGFLHAWMCLRTRDTEWDSTYFALLLRKQWWSQPSHVCSVADFRRIEGGRENRHRQCRGCIFSEVRQAEYVRSCLRWETWARNLWEGDDQPVGKSLNLLAEWQWMDSATGNYSEGEVDEPGANVRKICGKWGQLWVKQGAVKHGWDGMTLKKHADGSQQNA